MENSIKSSFIPQDARTPVRPKAVRSAGLSDLLVLIAIVLIVASIALAAGVFLYQQFLRTSSTSKLEQLQRAKEAFEPSLIQELTRLDDRMGAADKVLTEHVAPSIFFHLLEQLTLQTVAFTDLTFQATDAQNMNVKMRGVAASVNSIALQADYLSKSGALTSPIFSNIDRQQDGVHFDLTAIVNPAALRYTQMVTAPQVAPAVPGADFGDSPFAPQEGLPEEGAQ